MAGLYVEAGTWRSGYSAFSARDPVSEWVAKAAASNLGEDSMSRISNMREFIDQVSLYTLP